MGAIGCDGTCQATKGLGKFFGKEKRTERNVIKTKCHAWPSHHATCLAAIAENPFFIHPGPARLASEREGGGSDGRSVGPGQPLAESPTASLAMAIASPISETKNHLLTLQFSQQFLISDLPTCLSV